MAKSDDKEKSVCESIKRLKDHCNDSTSIIKRRWRENYDMFVYGSNFDDKQEWQTQFSVNKFQSAIRIAQGRLVNILVNTPDWYELTPKSTQNQKAEILAPAFQKMMDYYMDAAKFKRHASTFFMTSLISMGTLDVGWEARLIQNPEWILEKTNKDRQKEMARLAKNVANPQVETEMSGDEMTDSINAALEDLTLAATGQENKRKIDQYIQVGSLSLRDPNHELTYWDPTVQYMEDSLWRAYDFEIPRHKLNYFAKLGYFSKAKVKKVVSGNDLNSKSAMNGLRYRNTQQTNRTKSDTVKITVYYGPLFLEDDEPYKDNYWCVIANDTVILKEGDYPYWEPPGHKTAIVSTAVRQIPYRATGAGIGDNAVALQRIYDSNWQLICDTWRFGISGLNVVDYTTLVDKGQLDEGIYPGMTLQVRGNPKDVFQHISLTANLENQASVVQNMFEQAIDSLTGINELMVGGNNEHSRTSATESNARLQAGSENVNTIALDLEQNFLIPALQKMFARVLQYGMLDLNSNPELSSLFTEDEMAQLQNLTAQDRITILNQFYNFKIKGFSSSQDKDKQAQRDNELLQIINSGGILQGLVNLKNFMKRYFKNRDIKDVDDLLLLEGTPLELIQNENAVLMSGHFVQPSDMDDDEQHLSIHGPLMSLQEATPELQAHVQMHQQNLMLKQQAQAQGPQGGEPVQ